MMNTKAMRRLFYVIEINLLMWIAVLGGVLQPSAENSITYMVVAGTVLAAILQHWAYYNLLKKAKEQRKTQNQ